MMLKYNKLVIGVDQSYTASGISIAIDGKLVKVTSTDFKGCKNNTEKRKHLSNIIYRILEKNAHKASETLILIERIRTASNFGKKNDFGIRPDYLKMTGALVASIVDTAYEFNVPVYSVDTRSWKAQVVGNSKARKDKDGNRDAKGETVEFVQSLGFDLYVRDITRGKNKGKPIYDDDAADSACIALYGFIPKGKQRLKLEQ